MKTYFTIVQYAPNPHREEYFGIGLVMVSPESGEVVVRFSRRRINRINNALNIRKSSLLESAIQKIELFEKATARIGDGESGTSYSEKSKCNIFIRA
jgi:hypothetical protein